MSVMSTRGELIRTEGSSVGFPRRNAGAAGEFLDLREILTILRRKSHLAFTVFAATILVAIAYLLVVPSKYTATSIIHVDPRQQQVISSKTVLSGIGADAAAVESQVELIRSTAAVAKVVQRLNLLDDPEFSNPSLSELVLDALLPDRGRPDAEKAAIVRRNKAIARFRDQLHVQRRGLTYILEVSFESVDAEKAARIANMLADVYLSDQLAIKSDATTSASKRLTERIDTLQNRLRVSQRAVAAFKAENNIVDVGTADSGLTLNKRQVEQLNQQLILARARGAQAEAKYQQVRKIKEQKIDPGSLPNALNSEVISKLRVQYSAVARVEAEFSATYGPGHPNLTRIRSQLGKMRDEIKSELGRILTSAKNEYEIATTGVQSLTASLRKLEQQSLQYNQVKVGLEELEREAQADRTLFEQFLSRAKETSEQRSLQYADARIVAYAIEPVEPSSPKSLIILLIASVGGMGLAIGNVLVAQNFDRSYHRKADLERDTGIMCLAACPAIAPRDIGIAATGGGRFWNSINPFSSAGGRTARFEDNTDFRQLTGQLSVVQPGSMFADAIRSIRLGITAARPDLDPKILLVSSALPGEGKSTIAANLARSLARTGAITLLIDADTRNGALSQLLVSPGAPGLSEVLSGQQTLKQAAIFEPANNMFLLPAGQTRMDQDDTDMLVDDRLAQFLEIYRDGFDYIVIDGPPILPMVDGRILYHYADAALFVVEYGKTDDEAVLAAMSVLGSMRRKIAGTVLNKVDPGAGYAYHYKYSAPRS